MRYIKPADLTDTASSVNVNYSDIVTDKGDRLPDFSFCGYHSSDKPLPSAAPTITLNAGKGDQTKLIQNALDKFSTSGGVVVLSQGTYELLGQLRLHSKTVLRGAGMGKTVLTTKNGSVPLITMGNGDGKAKVGDAVAISDHYVPIGATNFTVKSITGLAVGFEMYIQRAVTPEWVRANGMSDLVRNGKPQLWLEPRKIASISGNIVTIDIPLTDSLDSRYIAPQLAPYTPPTGSSEMGVENLSITLSPTCSGKVLTDATCKGAALDIASWSTDSFARSLNITEYNSFVTVQPNTFRHTLDNINMHRNGPTDNGAGYAGGIGIEGTQILVSDCSAYGPLDAKFYSIWTTTLTPGPNAIVRFTAQQSSMLIQPHMRWAHGLLIDNSTTPLEFRNRATAGSGHGWPISGGVGWNVRGKFKLKVESPPLGVNWCIGCEGDKQTGTNGTFVEYGKQVSPGSLFEAQLAARKRKQDAVV
ncbi:hypothetical protein HYFRA_00007906 [Hymenoscyphus fraxineus]|uniref:Rhamnogalacturonase A/B/Epimerase-like pectate lyase domain-containing protein n=1 Tax=Hymenoscyphus fraxineus TaxID=746836 RepID=A0A9N9KNL2_9HELO|nr:hypothetical protein HYFRA_00007906 [Hymenoscyphus fraxineus]